VLKPIPDTNDRNAKRPSLRHSPTKTAQRCTVALLLDVEPVGWSAIGAVRRVKGIRWNSMSTIGDFFLSQYL